MSALLVHTLLKTPLDPLAVNEVLSWIEGFAPEGVKKYVWKREVLEGWRRTPKDAQWCNMTLNPTEVRLEIERHNKAVGPLEWCARHGSGARGPWEHRFVATPCITKKLEGYRVELARTTKNPKLFAMQGSVTILQVNPEYGSFQHSWGEKTFWCKKADVLIMELRVEYCSLIDTSD